jgi:ABC-type multidrug transport system ATPase subunit
MISLTRVTKAYGGQNVIDGVTFHVTRGECVRLIGARQSGRTTLLRIIATLVRPTSGSLSIDGVDTARNPVAARRKVVYVSSETLAGSRLRVDEYLRFVARSRGTSSDRRVTETCEQCGLAPAAAVDHLTSDGRATLAVAAALVAAPDIMLLDDAFAAIEVPERRERIADVIRQARASGTTMIVASSGTDELSAMSSRIVTLGRGQLQEGLPALRHQGEATWAR